MSVGSRSDLGVSFSLHSTDVPVASTTAIMLAKRYHRNQESTYTAYLVVLVIVLGLLDHVPSHDVVVSVVIVLLVVDKVVLAQEFGLVILEFPDHLHGLLLSDVVVLLGILASSGEVVRTLMNETVDELDRRKKDSPQSSCTFLPAATIACDPKALKAPPPHALSSPTPTQHPCLQACRNFDPSELKLQSKPPTAKHHHPPRRRPSQRAPPTTTTTMTSLLRRWLPSALRPSTRLVSTTAPLAGGGRTSPSLPNPHPN